MSQYFYQSVVPTELWSQMYSTRELQRFRPYGALAPFTLAAIPAATVAPLRGLRAGYIQRVPQKLRFCRTDEKQKLNVLTCPF